MNEIKTVHFKRPNGDGVTQNLGDQSGLGNGVRIKNGEAAAK